MRRGPSWIVALALCVGGVAACGDDGDASATTTTTATTTAESTTTALPDPGAAVDEFCAKTEEIEALAREQQAAGPTTPEQNAETQALITETAQMMFSLQSQTAQMVPGDVARFQECSSFFNIEQEG